MYICIYIYVRYYIIIYIIDMTYTHMNPHNMRKIKIKQAPSMPLHGWRQSWILRTRVERSCIQWLNNHHFWGVKMFEMRMVNHFHDG